MPPNANSASFWYSASDDMNAPTEATVTTSNGVEDTG